MISEDEKLKFVVSEIMESYNLLFETVKILYKEGKEEEELKDGNKKTYILIPILLLSFCFLDSLRRIDYILENGKDGNENKENRTHYKNFLNFFIINNDKYKEHNYLLTADNFYELRCGLVHSFSLKKILNGEVGISFIDGYITKDKSEMEKLRIIFESRFRQKYPQIKSFYLITVRSFLEIVKGGLIKMLDSYEEKLKKNPEKEKEKIRAHLDDLYEEFQESIRYYIVK